MNQLRPTTYERSCVFDIYRAIYRPGLANVSIKGCELAHTSDMRNAHKVHAVYRFRELPYQSLRAYVNGRSNVVRPPPPDIYRHLSRRYIAHLPIHIHIFIYTRTYTSGLEIEALFRFSLAIILGERISTYTVERNRARAPHQLR